MPRSLLNKVNQHLEGVVEGLNVSERLKEVLQYALFPGGKRIRPIFCLSLFRDLGGDIVDLLPSATSLELLHVASLVHDDLPALDNDDLRRGRATVHVAFNEASAILAGDYLTSLAFLTVATPCQESSRSRELVGPFVEILSRAYAKVCDGQLIDIEKSALTPVQIEELNLLKTASLFIAATELVAYALECSQKQREIIMRLGRVVGRSFQIADDYIDLFGTFESRGRVSSSDIRNCKLTLLSGLKENEAASVLTEAIKDLDSIFAELAHSFSGSQIADLSITRELCLGVLTRGIRKEASMEKISFQSF